MEYEKQREKLNVLAHEFQMQKDENRIQLKKTEATRLLDDDIYPIKTALPELEQHQTSLTEKLQPRKKQVTALELTYHQLHEKSQLSNSSTDAIEIYQAELRL